MFCSIIIITILDVTIITWNINFIKRHKGTREKAIKTVHITNLNYNLVQWQISQTNNSIEMECTEKFSEDNKMSVKYDSYNFCKYVWRTIGIDLMIVFRFLTLKRFKYEFVNCKQSKKNMCLVSIKLSLHTQLHIRLTEFLLLAVCCILGFYSSHTV